MSTSAVALKEWAVIVEALLRGEQILLLRKGGIADVGGEFRLEAERFVLWPTYLHQEPDWLAPEHAARLAPVLAARGAGNAYRLAGWADVAAIYEVPSRAALDGLAGEHLWSAEYLDLRWRYRPELPLYLLLLRAYRLPAVVTVTETAAQSGCRSWVPLDPPLALGPADPVVAEADFSRRSAAIAAALAGGAR
ncbi:MAG: DUF1802 family protein [Fimbriimonadaceae bacterium]|nr:DUF1802 family protein [Fimbriimonadaceae bacterium]